MCPIPHYLNVFLIIYPHELLLPLPPMILNLHQWISKTPELEIQNWKIYFENEI